METNSVPIDDELVDAAGNISTPARGDTATLGRRGGSASRVRRSGASLSATKLAAGRPEPCSGLWARVSKH